jgi:hypothetical protein
MLHLLETERGTITLSVPTMLIRGGRVAKSKRGSPIYRLA